MRLKAVCWSPSQPPHDVYLGHYQAGEEHSHVYVGLDPYGEPVFVRPADWQRWHKPAGRDGWRWLWCPKCESSTKHYSNGVLE